MSEFCVFVGYPKDTRGVFFYGPKNNKVFVSTNVTFLKNDYMKIYKLKSEAIIEEIIGKASTPSAPIVETPVIDEILSYRRKSSKSTTPRVIL